MNRQRWAISGLVVLAALTSSLAACTAGGGAAAPTTPARSGVDVLNEAVAKTKGKSYQFDVAYGNALTSRGTATGDGRATIAKIMIGDAASGVVVNADVMVLADAAYAKLNLGALAGVVPGLPAAGTWVHIDPAKAPGAARVGIKPGQDIFGPQSFVGGVVSATSTGPTGVTGTIDLAKAVPPGVPQSEVARLSDAQRVVPFTATLDLQGRITQIVVKVPALGAYPPSDLTSTYSNWGVAVDATRPTPTIEAPALLYSFLG